MLMTFIYIFNIHEIKFLHDKLETFYFYLLDTKNTSSFPATQLYANLCVLVPCNYLKFLQVTQTHLHSPTHTKSSHKYKQKSVLFAKKNHISNARQHRLLFSWQWKLWPLLGKKKSFFYTRWDVLFCLFLFSSVSEYLYRILEDSFMDENEFLRFFDVELVTVDSFFGHSNCCTF
jgi:hypothetical protein